MTEGELFQNLGKKQKTNLARSSSRVIVFRPVWELSYSRPAANSQGARLEWKLEARTSQSWKLFDCGGVVGGWRGINSSLLMKNVFEFEYSRKIPQNHWPLAFSSTDIGHIKGTHLPVFSLTMLPFELRVLSMLGKPSSSKLNLWGPHTALLFTLPVYEPAWEQFQPLKALRPFLWARKQASYASAHYLDSPGMGSWLHWCAIRLTLLLQGAFLCVATTAHLSTLHSMGNLVFPCSANQLSVDATKYWINAVKWWAIDFGFWFQTAFVWRCCSWPVIKQKEPCGREGTVWGWGAVS